MDFCFSIDKTKLKPNDRYWQFSVGSGHAALALRSDYQEQLKKAHDELGFKRVRFHGLFDDDMKVVTSLADYISLIPGSKKVRTTSFYHVGLVFDYILSIGMKPFVEVGFMPRALASGRRTAFYYKGNVTLPRHRQEWVNLIKDFARFCIDRYGVDEVRSWHFEIWNEPNLAFFFKGNQKDYFSLYKDTVNALKSVDDKIVVGGPSTSANLWLPEFREYCEKNNLPLDFLSTHHYPGDDLGLPLFTYSNIKRFVTTALRNPKDDIVDVIHKMLYMPEKLPLIKKDSMRNQVVKARKEAGNIPLIYSEWNVNPTLTAPAHDTIQSSAFIVKHVLDCQGLMEGSSFWTFSDIFEELTFFTRPFSGCFGLQTIHGIPKPSYHAFKLLNLLGDERYDLPVTDGSIEVAVFRKGDLLQFLVYKQNYEEGSEEGEEFNIQLDILVQSSGTLRRIDRNHCNPIALWKEMGCPETLLKEQVEDIILRTAMKEESIEFDNSGKGTLIKTFLADNDVQLIEVKM